MVAAEVMQDDEKFWPLAIGWPTSTDLNSAIRDYNEFPVFAGEWR